MYSIDPSFIFYTPITYYGTEEANLEFVYEEGEEFLPLPGEIDLTRPTQSFTGIYLHWFDP